MTLSRLDHPASPLRLTLIPDHDGYQIVDQHGGHYTLCPVNLEWALRFMLRFVELHDAVIDDASVERATWHSTSLGEGPTRLTSRPAGSVPVPAGGAATDLPPSPETFSLKVPDNVFPLWKDAS